MHIAACAPLHRICSAARNPSKQAGRQCQRKSNTSKCSLIMVDKLSDASPSAIAAKGICINTSQRISQQAALIGAFKLFSRIMYD